MEEIIEMPEGVNARKEGFELVVSGPLGEVRRKIINPYLTFEVEGNKVILRSKLEKRKAKRIVNTFRAHVKNMIKGVTEGFVYKMKAVYTHFPFTMKVEGNKLVIENFVGERAPRYAKIRDGVEVKINKQEIELKGIDIEAVSQTASNIEQATRIVGRDRRVFQDGIYITEKGK